MAEAVSSGNSSGVGSSSGRASSLVAAGILLSRLSGLIREACLAAFIGAGIQLDAFRVAMRIPNLLQNLFGEGVLSASFIPVYSELVDNEETEEAGRVAGAVAGLLFLVTAVLSAIGIVLAGPIVSLTAPGFEGETYDLAVSLMRITTLGIAVLVLSAWCLGILNSHRQFFLSYVAPVLWNAAQIIVLVLVGVLAWSTTKGVKAVAWAVLVGSLAQFLVQLPKVLGLVENLKLSLDRKSTNVASVISRFTPTLLGRGVVQISAFIDIALASLLAEKAVSNLAFAQTLYILPISLFAMSVAAAELPELSRIHSDDAAIANRAQIGQRRIAFFILFTAVAYLAVGDFIVGALLERGKFTADDTMAVWFILGVLALGLPAVASSRLLQNVMFAKGETRAPALIAVARVVVATAVGLALMYPLDKYVIFGRTVMSETDPRLAGVATTQPHLGPVGLAAGLVASAWTEYVLLSRLARSRVVGFLSPLRAFSPLALPAALSFLILTVLKLAVGWLPTLVGAPILLGVAGLLYTSLSFRRGIAEATLVLRPVRKLIWRGR